jgi:hypothetical protein
MLAAAAFVVLLSTDGVKLHQPDTSPLIDPRRPVSQITRDSFTLRYVTNAACETKVQFRQDELPLTTYGRTAPLVWQTAKGSVSGISHTITVSGLKPGKRYYYRVYNPNLKPTSKEKAWGASGGYDREFAVSTQAPKGEKTIIRIPVKVLLMPNVLNVASATGDGTPPAPEPPALTKEEIQKMKDEYAVSSRFFWVNSGMRLWVDYQFFIDERWQRWGAEPNTATGLYKGLPQCRSYGGKDYTDPGGGTHTIVDTKDITHVGTDPIVEAEPYSGQIEQAFVRRWNPNAKKWEFYNSGGGTYGVDQWPQGFPGRSQFLGGGDTAWLATHEFHHDLESHGEFSLSYREDDRIVFNHYAPRKRLVNGGNVDENTWTTNGPHGEHWDGMAYWDRTLTDAQWLRMYFGYTITVKDADGDGVPDNDARLPLDEKRFGSNPAKPATDGELSDLDKAMLSTWTPAPLQPSWIKTGFQSTIPDPKKRDNDGDGIPDSIDPYPLSPYDPVIVPMRAEIDGQASEWPSVPLAGEIKTPDVTATFKQSHDDAGYYGVFSIKGPWRRIDAIFDGEGLGVYSGVGVQSFQVLNLAASGGVAAGPDVGVVDVKITPFKAPGLKWRATRSGETTVFEFSLPNRGEGLWYWNRGGREIGAEVNVWDQQNRGFSFGQPYHLIYCRMLEPHGQAPLPPNPPAMLDDGPGITVLRPGDPKLKVTGQWEREGEALVYKGGEEEGSVSVEVPKTGDFDLLATVEGTSDGIVGGFAQGQKITAGLGYVAFVGGYGNLSSRMRLNGQEFGDEPEKMTPGRHKVQISRRRGGVWMLFDGKPLIYAVDPTPQLQLTRLALIGGYNGNQKFYDLRFRLY